MTSEVSSKFAMCGDDVPDKLKNKAKAATETSPKKFQYSLKKKGWGGRVVNKYSWN